MQTVSRTSPHVGLAEGTRFNQTETKRGIPIEMEAQKETG